MTGDNLALVAGTYANSNDAAADFATLKGGQDAGEYKVVGAVVMSSDDQGNVSVDEHGTGEVGGGTAVGAVGGLVVGLFAPPLLAATAIGAGIGAGIGALTKRHNEKQMGVDLEQYMPPGTSAVVAVVDDKYADNVEKALVKADKKVNKAIDSGDVDKLDKALKDSGYDIDDAINS